MFRSIIGTWNPAGIKGDKGDKGDQGDPGPAAGPGSITGDMLAPRWEDLLVPLITTSAGAITPPEIATFLGTTAAYRFRHTRDDDVFFTRQIPHGWNPGIVKPHLHWSAGAPGAPLVGKAIKFILEVTFASVNGDFIQPTQIIPFTDTITNNNYHHEITAEQNLDLTGYGASTELICHLYRDNSVADNATTGIWAFDLDFHATMQGIGSVNSNGTGGH